MDMDEARIQIMIPAYNDVDKLDVTVQSIKNQNYRAENIFIIMADFGSEDGTYEKMLTYDRKRLGVYRCEKSKNRRQMISEMVKIGNYTYPGGLFCFQVVVYPGEILYPDCLRKCSQTLMDNWHCNPNMVICETDIIGVEGKVISQIPLFDDDRVIDGRHEMREYISRGFKHEVFCMGMGFNRRKYRAAGECNEQRWWNKCARENNERNVLYIREPVAAVNFIRYQDELEEILLRWESIIVQLRIYESKFGKVFDNQYESLAKKNLAQYAIWRSYLLMQENKCKEAEDCLLISGVIDSDVLKQDIYRYMQGRINGDFVCGEEYIKTYFEKNGMV